MPDDAVLLDWLEAVSGAHTIDVSKHRGRWCVCVQRKADALGLCWGRGNDLREAMQAARSAWSRLGESNRSG